MMGSFEASLKKAPCPAPSLTARARGRACVSACVCKRARVYESAREQEAAARIPRHSFAAPAHRAPVGSARGHICAGTGAHPCHICAGTCWACA